MKPKEMKEKAETYLKSVIGKGKVVRVGDIANAIGVTPRSLERVFRAANLPSPKKWELELRTTAAIEAYVGGNISEKTVAGNFGFSDSCHFSRTVRRLRGISPLQLRDARRGTPATA